jgi:hypothetical protein
MKSRPIIFQAPTVRAVLDGSKTQTRRQIKCKPCYQIEERADGSKWPWMYDADQDADHWLPCPYGQPGDELWVREAWRTERHFDHLPPRDLDPTLRMTPVQYEAGPYADVLDGKLRPSMFMPRCASRIALTVTGVRVERLQDISAQDCWAEGIPFSPDTDPRHEYRYLWESIHGADSWEANPWVWVLEFERKTP